MPKVLLALLTSTALVPGFSISPAHAQASGPIPSNGTASVGAADTPGLPASQDTAQQPDPATEADDTTDIVVRGYRAALQSAQELKRNSSAIVDSVVSDDIAKVPDNNANETLARVVGVQVVRNNDEAGDVLVRGLPNVSTTFNGRELFTTNDRNLHLIDFPAGVLAGADVYKSGIPELIEPGLAGLINLRSRRPFDIKGAQIAGEIRGAYNEQAKKAEPSANLLVSNRWNTPIGELGAMVNISYVRTTFRNADRYADTPIIDRNGFNPANPVTVTTPGVGLFKFAANAGNHYEKGTRERGGVNGALQWRPSGNTEIYLEGLYQGYRGNVFTDAFNVNFERPDVNGVAPTISNVVLNPDNPSQAASFTKTGGYVPEFWRSAGEGRTDTYQGALGFKWSQGIATLTGDFAYTWSKYQENRVNVDAQLATAPIVNVQWNVGQTAIFNLGGFNASDPANYVWRGLYQKDYAELGDGVQGRIDLALDTAASWLPTIKFGVRATDRNASSVVNDRYAYTGTLGIPLASLPTGPLELITDGYGKDPQEFRRWLMPTFDAMRDNSDALRQAAYSATGQANFASAEIPDIPTNGFKVKEQTYAAYAQGNYAVDIGSIAIDGIFGVRMSNTVGRYSGFGTVVGSDGVGRATPQSVKQNYVDVLPSFSSRIKFTPDLQMRLAVNKSRTRPSFGQLNPSLNITQSTVGSSQYDAVGGGGNPDLKPITSINYDATFEYYFSKSGSFTVAAFYHDLDGFINNYTSDVQDPVYGRLQLSRPENAGKGRIKGVEANIQSFFNFLPGWLSGFGAQANVTYLDGKYELPLRFGQPDSMVQIPGLSRWTYNLIGFYEKGPITARVSYNRRSEWVNNYNRNGNEELFKGELTRPVSRLDLSLQYDILKNFSIVGQVQNALKQNFSTYRYYNETDWFPRDVRVEGRYYSLGLRFRL